MGIGNLNQIAVGVLLIFVYLPKQAGLLGIPKVRRQFAPFEEFIQRFKPNLKRGIFAGVPFQGVQNVGGDILRIIPVPLVPFLQGANL
ncbi:MAG: hypothetical protein ACKN9T_09615 [Candidatus Methylumidiphilus sp.]